MSGFAFPPPPPPPPKATVDDFQNISTSRGGRGGQGRDRGSNRDRGRGRGRGRGDSTPSYVQQRPSHGSVFPGAQSSNAFTSLGHPQGLQRNNGHPSTLPNLPPGAYVNPRFAGPQNGLDRPARGFAQAYNTGPKSASPPSAPPERTVAGHKRKLEVLRGPQREPRERSIQSESHSALAVPSFGAPILPAKPRSDQQSRVQMNSKPAINALGLTPGSGDPQYLQSDDEQEDQEVDEESMYAELGTKLTFEHNGSVLTLNSTADLVAWQQERKKKWPTRARMAEKDAERQRIGEMRKTLLNKASLLADETAAQRSGPVSSKGRTTYRDGRSEASKDLSTSSTTATTTKAESKLAKARRELDQQTTKLEALRKGVAKSEAYLEQAKAAQVEEDDKMIESAIQADGTVVKDDAIQDDEVSDAPSDLLSESSVVNSDSSDSDDSNSDAPPEETTSKVPIQTSTGTGKPICKYFAASGYCRDGDACRFRHELPARGSAVRQPLDQQQSLRSERDAAPKLENVLQSNKRTLYERLMDQQELEEDRLALQVIKHLGNAGFFATGEGLAES